MGTEPRAEDCFSQERYILGMEGLLVAARELVTARDRATIERLVCGAARRLTGADGATFVLREDDHCYFADEDAASPLWKGRRFPVEACISGWAMLNRKPAIIEDVSRDERIPLDAYRATFVKSVAVVPIRTLDPIGAIGIYWAATHRPSQHEVHLLQALADSAAVAIENLQARQELEARTQAAARELQAAKEEIQNLSLTDAVTGLPNRRGFFLFAEQARKLAARAGKQAAIVLADIEGLAAVNERQGPEAGDAMLRDFAGVLSGTFRDSDVVGRLGNEAFCVFGAELDMNPDVLVARLEYNIAKFNAEHPGPAPLAARAGVCRCPFKRGETLEDIVARAANAMFERRHLRSQAG